jgi:molybdopterin biosynthesis enzyme
MPQDDDGAKYPMVAVDAALRAVLDAAAPLPTERVPLLDGGAAPALGRCLADNITARAPHPPFRASISDGYCCHATEAPQKLRNDRATQLAGGASTSPLARGACRYITTGAPLPTGADVVAKQEHCSIQGEVVSLPALRPGADVRTVGSDWAAGDELCAPHTELAPADLAILAAAGHDHVDVCRRPRVRVYSSGAELHQRGPFDATRHVRDANRAGLIALLGDGSAYGGNAIVEDGGILPDDFGAWKDALNDALETCDVVVTTGGASVGRADFAKRALEAAARCKVRFGRLHMKPGKECGVLIPFS